MTRRAETQRLLAILSLQFVGFVLSIAIVGLTARTILIYRSTQSGKIAMGGGAIMSGWREPDSHFMAPIFSLLGTGVAGLGLGGSTFIFTTFTVCATGNDESMCTDNASYSRKGKESSTIG